MWPGFSLCTHKVDLFCKTTPCVTQPSMPPNLMLRQSFIMPRFALVPKFLACHRRQQQRFSSLFAWKQLTVFSQWAPNTTITTWGHVVSPVVVAFCVSSFPKLRCSDLLQWLLYSRKSVMNSFVKKFWNLEVENLSCSCRFGGACFIGPWCGVGTETSVWFLLQYHCFYSALCFQYCCCCCCSIARSCCCTRVNASMKDVWSCKWTGLSSSCHRRLFFLACWQIFLPWKIRPISWRVN